MMRKIVGCVAILATLLSAAACGGDDDSAEPERETTSSTAAANEGGEEVDMAAAHRLNQACAAHPQFIQSVTALNDQASPDVLDASADVIFAGLKGLARVEGHPELRADVEIVLPVVEQLANELRPGLSPDDVTRIAADSRFSGDEGVRDALLRIIDYPLGCNAG